MNWIIRPSVVLAVGAFVLKLYVLNMTIGLVIGTIAFVGFLVWASE